MHQFSMTQKLDIIRPRKKARHSLHKLVDTEIVSNDQSKRGIKVYV